ncbi:MAG: hypothetical protein STSR0008_07380 [Ignavibacterium sp.]
MGPLAPQIIGNELNLIVAFLIGIGFGFALEQAGFSTSKKLVGLFYGYDFTVLKVFMTGGLTAMTGVIILTHFGLLDIDLVYINPLYLWPAIVGGLIMGLGFVIGGFCPGTSICAAAIGKIDAMYFVLGSFIGVYIFAEGYPLFEGLYKSSFYGSPFIYDTLGISRGLFAFSFIMIAIILYWIVSWIQAKINKQEIIFNNYKTYIPISIIAFIIAFSTLFLPNKKDSILSKVNDINFIYSQQIDKISTDELAIRLLKNDKSLQLIDVRDIQEFNKSALPNAFHTEMNNLFTKDLNKILSTKGKINIFYSDDELNAKKAALIAKELDIKNIFILEGGYNNFKEEYLTINYETINTNNNNYDLIRFRKEASPQIIKLIEESKPKAVVKQVNKRALGGC